MDLSKFPIIDHHAHNLLKPEVAENYPYTTFFTEAYDPKIIKNHVEHTIFYQRSIRDIAQLLNCEATEESIIQTRQKLGLENLTKLCCNAANISAIFLDDGFLPEQVLPWQWHQQFTSIKRVLRIEYLAETLIKQENKFEDFLARFCSTIESPPSEVIALKSIIAYRTGLNIEFTPVEVAQSSFKKIKQQNQNNSLRLSDKPLLDFLLIQALEIAAKQQIPIQFHTGFGYPDLDL